MPENEKTFTVTFRTEAELEAAQQALQALEKTKAAALEGVQATKESGETERVASKATEELTSKKGALMQVVRGLHQEVPFMGAALRALVSPVTLCATAVGFLVSAIKSYVDKANAAAQREILSEMLASQVTSLNRLQAQFDSTTATLERGILKIGTAERTTLGQLAELNKHLNDQMGLIERLREAHLNYAKAQVQARLARGEITREEAIRQEGHLSASAERQKVEQDIQRAVNAAAQTRYAVAVQQGKVAGLQAGLPAMKVEYTTAQRTAEAAEKGVGGFDFRDEEQQLADLKTKQAEWIATRELFAKTGQVPLDAGIYMGQKYGPTAGIFVGAFRTALDKEIAEIEGMIEGLSKAAENRKVLADKAKARFAEVKARYDEQVAALKAAVGDLESLKKQASEAASYLQILRQWLPQIAATQQATGALTTQTQASVAQSQTDKEIGEALQALYQHGTPIPAAILQLMKARANELRPPANVPTPPRFPEPFVRPAPSAPLDQWMYPPARPTTPRGDGMATQTIGQEIVKRLLEGNGLLDKNFQTVIHLLDEQNNRQREIDYRLRNVESHARVAQ